MSEAKYLRDAFVASGASRRELRAGEQLFACADEVVSMHLLTSGRVDLLRRREDGNPVILQRAVEGEVIAEASVFAERYHCDAEAATDTRLLVLPALRFRTLLHGMAGFGEKWAHYLSRQLIRARARAEILAHRRVSDRLDLWSALRSEGEQLPWAQVAAEIGVSPEALYRELAVRRAASGGSDADEDHSRSRSA